MTSIFSGTSADGGRKAIRTFSENSVYPIVEPERLLSSIHRTRILQEIKEVAGLPDEYFDTLYHGLIEGFAAFVQILPVNNEARLSSILDEGLLRALFALQVQQKSSKDEVDPLMSYVLFSACLLFDVACVIENRTIIISERGGSFIRIWQPMVEGSMPIGGYYRIRRSGGLTPWSCRRNAISLAGKLMPQAGYDWIFQNSHAFNIWVALLSEDKEGAGVLAMYMDRISEMLEEFKTSVEYYVQTNIEEFEPTDTKEAELFLAWYLQELEKGNLRFLQAADDRMLITQDAFNHYAAMNKQVSAKDILEGLKKLGITTAELETFYSSLQRAKQSSFAKQHGLGVGNSLFGAGAGQDAVKGAPALPIVNPIVTHADQLRLGGGKVEGPGGILYGYVVNIAAGMLLPPGMVNSNAFSSPENIVSSNPGQALSNQLPSLEAAKPTDVNLRAPIMVK